MSSLSQAEKQASTYLRKQKELKDKDESGGTEEDLDRVRAQFKKATTYGEKKVSLALQTYELVDKHIRKLDTDLKRFEEDLAKEAAKGKANAAARKPVKRKSKALKPAAVQEKKSRKRPLEPTPKPPEPVARPVEGDMPIHPDEPTYCVCHRVSFGQMVGCDNQDCPIEWFHFECVGLTSSPKGKWYCSECTETMRKRQKT
eukprot:TRINITY_DN2668_c0_g1_i2.p1 TRINITY_DN2668_c0_g1~~TRINITY_DN2668_c0_g1_i2.p1  ORF type:complete len:201 (-),score=44.91 TRINITY_DN2668_c0_g1_i2:99-701(-)